MIEPSGARSSAERLLSAVQRLRAGTRAYLRAPHRPYSIKVLRLCLENAISHLSRSHDLPQSLEHERTILFVSCETVCRVIDSAEPDAILPTTTTRIRDLGGSLEVYEKLLRRHTRPCADSRR